jgi:Fe-S cluster assembly protein SufD
MGADLSEPGSSWRETHLISTGGKEHLDLDSQVRLAARHTYSDIQVKAVADGNSRAIFTGNLLMEPAAVQSEAYLADHILLLSDGARADSIPGLEIKAADVKASHAASVGQVDEEQMFYLESRGLAPAEARRLIVVGFLRSLMERMPLPFVQEILDPLLETKVSP